MARPLREGHACVVWQGLGPVKQQSNGEMRCNPDANPERVEVERLLRTAAYYERLGCVNVATALKALAQAKRRRGHEGPGPAAAVGAP